MSHRHQTIRGITRHFVLAAGGTGGHMIPAHALAAELMPARPSRRADHRRARRALPRPVRRACRRISCPPGGWPAGRSAGCARSRAIHAGREMARQLYRTFEPSAVVGFGGYPALPALLAALEGRHADRDPRAECGARPHQPAARAPRRCDRHRLLRGRAAAPRGMPRKVHVVGNPVRDEIAALRDQPFPPITEDGIFRILVTGGSQGATILSEVVPEGLGLMPRHLPPPDAGDAAMPARGYRGGARANMPGSASPPISPPICPICPTGSAGRIS